MDLLIAFAVFLSVMAVALIMGLSMIVPLLIGLIAFIAVGLHRGYKLPVLAGMAVSGTKDALIVIKVMTFIGFLTAAWRCCGTITIFVYYGMNIITPSLFLLIAFLLSALLSYGIGTSFGVAATVGVIFMTLARSGGVDPVITAGVIMSGVYFGDRGSPVSSSANMVAGVTQTDIFDNVARMMKSGLLPLLLTLIIYGILSVTHPMQSIDEAFIAEYEATFTLSLWAFLPAVLMLLLPLLKVKVIHAMMLSTVSGILVGWKIEGFTISELLKICIFGYHPEGSDLVRMLDGGGFLSMLPIVGIVLLSCSYSGIFKGTGMLNGIQNKLSGLCAKYGRFPALLLLTVGLSSVFCTQTIATLMCASLMETPYEDNGGTKKELALDLENSVILISCFIPWSLGWTIPTSFFGAGISSMPYACYMYLVPLCWLVTKKYFKNRI
ncbi:MAG: sodium:proton antiporter [Firmicutes bacterium]|nr:sodium:proton antiporter [Bacillota bacterium]